MFKDYYLILGITKQATSDDIKSAYINLSQKFYANRKKGINITDFMQDINEAYKILHNDLTRTRYDIEYEEFLKFKKELCKIKDSTNDVYLNYYEYNIHDKKLQQDVISARTFAKTLVRDFLNSLEKDMKTACKGAWYEIKPFIVFVIAFSIIGTVILCFSS